VEGRGVSVMVGRKLISSSDSSSTGKTGVLGTLRIVLEGGWASRGSAWGAVAVLDLVERGLGVGFANSAAGTPGGRPARFFDISEPDLVEVETAGTRRLLDGASEAGARVRLVVRGFGCETAGVSVSEPPDRKRLAGGSSGRLVAAALRFGAMTEGDDQLQLDATSYSFHVHIVLDRNGQEE
jgi:hypothetical protein